MLRRQTYKHKKTPQPPFGGSCGVFSFHLRNYPRTPPDPVLMGVWRGRLSATDACVVWLPLKGRELVITDNIAFFLGFLPVLETWFVHFRKLYHHYTESQGKFLPKSGNSQKYFLDRFCQINTKPINIMAVDDGSGTYSTINIGLKLLLAL